VPLTHRCYQHLNARRSTHQGTLPSALTAHARRRPARPPARRRRQTPLPNPTVKLRRHSPPSQPYLTPKPRPPRRRQDPPTQKPHPHLKFPTLSK